MVPIRSAFLAIIASLLAVALRAQQDTTHPHAAPTAPLLTGYRLATELGAAVTVLDVDSLLRESPVHTLTELLTGRVPGLEVLASSGTLGTGSRILLRGAASFFATSAPQIYVDGIRADDEAATLLVPVGGQTTSRVDDIDVERIATIAILPGPAATALYGTDAANGVLLITTKRGVPGRSRVRACRENRGAAQPLDFPGNFRAVDSSGARCFAADVASGRCRLLSGNVLAAPASSPFRNGYLRQYGVSASGGSTSKRYSVAAQWDGFGGVYGLPGGEQARLATTGGLRADVLNPNYQQRTDLRGSGQLVSGDRADLTVNAGYFASNLRLPSNDNGPGILSSGLLGGDSTRGGWGTFLPGELFQVTTSQHVERVNGSLAAAWRPVAQLNVRAVAGLDHTDQQDGQVQRPGEGPNGSLGLSSVEQGRRRGSRSTGTVTATGMFEVSPALSMRTTAEVHYFKNSVDLFDSTALVFGNLISIRQGRLRAVTSTFGLVLQQQVAWRDRLFVTAGLRRDATTRFHVDDPAAVYPSLGVSWRGPVAAGDFPLTSWRLRAAYGAAGREAVLVGHRPERSRELEAGADAELLKGRVTFSGTIYRKRTSNVVAAVFVLPGTPGGGFDVFDAAAVTNKGIELSLAASLVERPDVAWSVGLSAWGNRNRVAMSGLVSTVVFTGGGGLLQIAESGLPLGSYAGNPILGYADANGDGLVSPNEVDVAAGRGFLGTPFPTQGASLSSALTLRRRFRIAGLLEYRGGNSQLNGTEETRCIWGSCRASSDPSTPLADQVPLAAWQAGTPAGWVESASFLKLREISVAITAPATWAGHLGAAGMTFTLAGRNLLTLTSYKGLDPEVNAHGTEGAVFEDLFTQPLPRYWTARLDLTF